jgi:hypothetical protein
VEGEEAGFGGCVVGWISVSPADTSAGSDGQRFAQPRWPSTLLMVTIVPRPAESMAGRKALMVWKCEWRFTLRFLS